MTIPAKTGSSTDTYPRRTFLVRSAAAGTAMACFPGGFLPCLGADLAKCPIVVFSKIYQELKLGFGDAADLTREAGLNGVDCPVRPGGEIVPERATDEMPAYVEALRQRKLSMPLITTAITGTSSPYAAEILRTAKKLGVQYYRLGFVDRDRNASADQQVKEFKARLRDLSVMNREIGIGALFQNHSSGGKPTSVGADLEELLEIVSDCDPAQVGVAFDIGHAILIHGREWRPWFDKLKRHIKVAYIKDAKPGVGFVPFGEGEIPNSGYFKDLKKIGYNAPFCIHIEFDWSDKGRSKTRAALGKAVRESRAVLQKWMMEG